MGHHQQCCPVQVLPQGAQLALYLPESASGLHSVKGFVFVVCFVIFEVKTLQVGSFLCVASNPAAMATPDVRSFHTLSNLLLRSFHCANASVMRKSWHFYAQSCSTCLHKAHDVSHSACTIHNLQPAKAYCTSVETILSAFLFNPFCLLLLYIVVCLHAVSSKVASTTHMQLRMSIMSFYFLFSDC